MQKIFLMIGATLGALAVVLGAFGAHALNSLLEKSGRIETYDTAVKYHFFHVIALLIVGILMFYFTNKWLIYSGWAFVVGIVVFSGSLYALCLTGWTKLGMITPLGGLALIAGWLFMLIAILKSSA